MDPTTTPAAPAKRQAPAKSNTTAAPANGAAKPEESKADKFRRLANARVAPALAKIRRVGKLASRASYSYSDEQVAVIMRALDDEVDAVRRAFAGATTAAPLFRL
jgi:hypothetical protein